MEQIRKTFPFWSKSIEEIYNQTSSKPEGLTEEEVEKRIELYGLNQLTEKKKHILLQFLSKFLNPLILILLFANVISAVLGDITSFVIITIIVFLSAFIDFYQEYQAGEAAEKLRKKVALTATAIRDGEQKEIPASHVTIGDILILSAGDIIPADGRILEEKELLVDQAALTGESYPQAKHTDIEVSEKSSLADRKNCVFMGTHVLSGEGKVLIVTIGAQTEFGQVAKQLIEKRPKTEFQLGIEKFGFLLMKTTLILVIAVFFINAFIKHDILNSFLFALALAVGLTPELLPMVITINLSKGALRMSKKGVIVKELPAIQNLGSMDILCTDKTGTLTEGKIALNSYEDITGKKEENVLNYAQLNSFYQTGLKNPIDQAILAHHPAVITDYQKIDEVPFDFVRKRLSVVVKHNKMNILTTKGASEGILALCTHYQEGNKLRPLTKELLEKLEQRFQKLSQDGYRVIAVAIKQVESKKEYTADDEKELSFLGFITFLDPPKSSAKDSLQLLENQGISVKILTGDNELVTQKVYQDINLPVGDILTGPEIDSMSDFALLHHVKKTTIFARLNPEHKKRVIQALKRDGYVVGFLGDGINDSPPMRAADIGISVNNAVDVAKQSADIILLHKDLHVLAEGVSEGRKTHGNVMKYIMMGTSSNFGNMFSVAGASLFLPFIPMLPIQILLNNMLYDLSQLFVPSDNVDQAHLIKPKKWNVKFIKHFMLVFGPISSIFDFVTFFVMLSVFKASVHLFQTGWFVESIVTQTLIIFSIRTRLIPFFRSKPGKWLALSSLFITLIGLILPFTPLAPLFAFLPLPIKFYMILSIIVVVYFTLVEVAKIWFYKRFEL